MGKDSPVYLKRKSKKRVVAQPVLNTTPDVSFCSLGNHDCSTRTDP